jgi:hypothetical protein
MTCFYAPAKAYEPKSGADLLAHYSGVIRRIKPVAQNPVFIAVKPVAKADAYQERQFMIEAHAMIDGQGGNVSSMAEILDAVVRASGILKTEICSRSRTWRHSRARNVYFYLCRERTGRSFSAIGRLVGGRDHSTVLSGARRAADNARFGPYADIIFKAIAILDGKAT